MAIADDLSVAVNGDVRWTGGATVYESLELHRFLNLIAAQGTPSTADDLSDITFVTPSVRDTDNVIRLINGYNIDDEVAEHFFNGSISQAAGATVYYALTVLGSVNDANTQIMLIQDNDLYQFTTTPAAPFWGDQSGGGFNGDAANNILMRCLVKGRVDGADIDGKRIRVQARHWGDSFFSFPVTLADGISTAAINTLPDLQNDTLQATVTAYTHVTNTEGFQLIDINNGNGDQEYYSKWTYGVDTSGDGLKGIWEYVKDLAGTGTAKTIHGISGELFQGITHSVPYDNEASGPFVEDEVLAWGTSFAYDTEAGGPFTLGEYVTIGASGAAGKLVHLVDNGTDGTMVVALESTAITLLDNDVVTGLTSGATAAVNGAITANGDSGGTGLLLALDDDGATGNMYIQLLTGNAPVDNLQLIGQTSNATADTNGAFTARAVSPVFLGNYTGSLQGAYGIGIDEGDLSATDTVETLAGTTQTPPNNVVFSVTGLVAGEDRVLVGPGDTGVLDEDQDTLNGALTGAAVVAIVVNNAIPTDTPTTGKIRVRNSIGIYVEQPYTSYTGFTYTVPSTDYSVNNAADGSNVFIGYIDRLATGSTESFTSIFLATRELFVRVRDGGAVGSTPIKTFEVPAFLTATGGTVAAIRTSDA